MKEVTISRRSFLRSGSGAAAAIGVAGVGLSPGDAQADNGSGATTLDYPSTAIGKAAEMKPGEALAFSYPDTSSPCMAVKFDQPVAGGVGPEGNIVAYSILCTHMGCPLAYDGEEQVFRCSCHYSLFDAEKQGQMITGQATEDLPRIVLEHDQDTDTISATGVDGLIYGRQANIL